MHSLPLLNASNISLQSRVIFIIQHLHIDEAFRLCDLTWPDLAQVVILSALVAVALAAPQQYAQQQRQYSDAPAQYSYDYKVQDDTSGVDFGQNESRDGAVTQGSYYVALPDGRVQRVTYTVSGDGGYVAEVSYEGEAQYPAAASSQPAYRPAAPQRPY